MTCKPPHSSGLHSHYLLHHLLSAELLRNVQTAIPTHQGLWVAPYRYPKVPISIQPHDPTDGSALRACDSVLPSSAPPAAAFVCNTLCTFGQRNAYMCVAITGRTAASNMNIRYHITWCLRPPTSLRCSLLLLTERTMWRASPALQSQRIFTEAMPTQSPNER